MGLRILPRTFYARPTVEVARALLGKVLVHGEKQGRILEVEAYLGQGDEAAHVWRGMTKRTEVIFGPPGHAYVYFVYGMYDCLNVVAEEEGTPGSVLIRAVEGHGNGPGKLTLSMGITRKQNGADLTRGTLTIREAEIAQPMRIVVTPRIGIQRSKDLPLRFVVC
jgi:DNA-3-methyladenine glycosylase